MRTLGDIIATRSGGVYRHVGHGVTIPPTSSEPPRLIQLSGPADKSELLQAFARIFEFPNWFGHNWDALEECLLENPPGPGGVILRLSSVHPLADRDPDALHTVVEILRDVAAAWKLRGELFIVLLEDGGKLTADLEEVKAA